MIDVKTDNSIHNALCQPIVWAEQNIWT